MKLLQAGDYAIWQKQKIVRLVEEVLRDDDHFMGPEVPIQERFDTMLVAGLPDGEKRDLLNDMSRWLVRCEQTAEEFTASGFDLLYVNPMQLIAVAAKLGGSDPQP